jgi:hypothetical protein
MRHLLWLPFALLASAVAAQADQRDRIHVADGSIVTGRIVDPFAPSVWTIDTGDRRIRVARSEVLTSDLVADRLAAWLERRRQLGDAPKAQAYLIDAAARDGLPGLATLQALWVALHDDDNAHAHRWLGHERGKDGWLWPSDGRQLTRAAFERALPERPLRLVGERFALAADRDLAAAVATLFDLEALGVAFRSRFGRDLQLREVLTPITVELHRDAASFPKWGFRPRPFYVPPPWGDVVRTWFATPSSLRPERLFFVGTEALLYRMLIGEVSRQDERDRACAWLEIGLGMQMELSMQGPPGFAGDGPLRGADLQALQALNRSSKLTHLLRLPMYGGFYLEDDADSASHWATATMLTTWLVSADNQPDTRGPFLGFCREALGAKKGDSSSVFDRCMGRPIEALEAPFTAWLRQVATR